MCSYPDLLNIYHLFINDQVNIVIESPRRTRGNSSTIFAEPEENNRFRIVGEVLSNFVVNYVNRGSNWCL